MGELQAELNRLAGTTGLDAQGAANVYAGTTGLDLVGALNAKAGNTERRELAGVLNQLAGTTGLGVNAAAAAAAFNPLTLVSGLLVGVWADDPLWSKPANGATVSSWRNAGSVTGDPAQGTAGARPVFRSAATLMNNRPTVDFDGSDDSLSFDISNVAQPFQMVVAARSRDGADSSLQVMVGVGGATGRGVLKSAANAWGVSAGSTVSGGTPNTSPHILRAVVNGASSSVWVDGVQVGAGDAGAASMTVFTLGAGSTDALSTGNFFDGHIGFAGAWPITSDLTNLCRGLGVYYGVSVA